MKKRQNKSRVPTKEKCKHTDVTVYLRKKRKIWEVHQKKKHTKRKERR